MKYNIVGYGSLMSHRSYCKTLSNRKFVPVIVKGYKRVFNLDEDLKKEGDVLNLLKSSEHLFNGVLFEVDEKELKKIKEREDDYNLEEAWSYEFPNGKKLRKCWLFVDYIVSIDKGKYKPAKNYFKLCREAAYHISEEFGRMWDETTFSSNGEKISNWIKKNKEYDSV